MCIFVCEDHADGQDGFLSLDLSWEGVSAEPFSRAGGVGAGDWRPAQGGLPICFLVSGSERIDNSSHRMVSGPA